MSQLLPFVDEKALAVLRLRDRGLPVGELKPIRVCVPGRSGACSVRHAPQQGYQPARMKPFADLLDRLLYTPQRNVKLTLMLDYFRSVPDPDRGWGLAALTGALDFRHAKPDLIRDLVQARTDPVLFGWSYDFVGDLAETAALIWPERPPGRDWPRLEEVVRALDDPAQERPARGLVAAGSTRSTPPAAGRLLKLVTGSLRVGVSARLTKLALAGLRRGRPGRGRGGLARAGTALWCSVRLARRQGPRPAAEALPVFRPLMLATSARGRGPAEARAGLERTSPSGNGTGSACRSPPRGAGRGSSPGPATRSRRPSPRSSRPFGFRAVLDGELLVEAGRGGRLLQRPAAAPEPQGRHRRHAARAPGLRPSLRHPVRRRRRISAPCRSSTVGGASRPSMPASGRPRMDLSPLVPIRPCSWSARPAAPGGARHPGRRADAQAQGQPLPRRAGPRACGGNGSATRTCWTWC